MRRFIIIFERASYVVCTRFTSPVHIFGCSSACCTVPMPGRRSARLPQLVVQAHLPCDTLPGPALRVVLLLPMASDRTGRAGESLRPLMSIDIVTDMRPVEDMALEVFEWYCGWLSSVLEFARYTCGKLVPSDRYQQPGYERLGDSSQIAGNSHPRENRPRGCQASTASARSQSSWDQPYPGLQF